MARQTALPATLPPRLVGREAAAAYLSVSPNKFDQMVLDGRMPRAKVIDARKAWDIRAIDIAVDELPCDGLDLSRDTSWDDV